MKVKWIPNEIMAQGLTGLKGNEFIYFTNLILQMQRRIYKPEGAISKTSEFSRLLGTDPIFL